MVRNIYKIEFKWENKEQFGILALLMHVIYPKSKYQSSMLGVGVYDEC